MELDESNEELLFIRHALQVMGNPPNLHEEIHPGGEWRVGKIRLTWGLRTITEPPTLHHDGPEFSATIPYLPRDLLERIAIWKSHLRTAQALDFRDRIILTAILEWQI